MAVRAAELLRPFRSTPEAVVRGRRRPSAGRAASSVFRVRGRDGPPRRLPQRRRRRGARARSSPARGLRPDLVFGAMADKDVESDGAPRSAPCVRRIRLVPRGSPRAAAPEELVRRFARRRGRTRAAARGPRRRLSKSCSGDPASEPIIVAGSLYLVGEARAAPLRPPRRKTMTTAAAPFTRDHFERLEEERLAIFASKSARAVRPRGPVSSSPGDAGRTTRGTATASSTRARSGG